MPRIPSVPKYLRVILRLNPCFVHLYELLVALLQARCHIFAVFAKEAFRTSWHTFCIMDRVGETERTRIMRLKSFLVGSMLAATLAGCATGLPSDMTVAEYCANPDRAAEDVCRLKVEIDGNATALAETNMSLREARNIADSAVSAAASAQASADAAQSRADAAYSLANSAYLQEKDLECKTTTIQKSNTGTCEPGYTVMGCVQTRYTHRAGGLSFLRELNNEQCRFNSRVLEMQVRCCRASATAAGS